MGFKKNVAFKRVVFLFAFSFILIFTLNANADYQTYLLPGVYMQNSGTDLDVNIYSVPTVYDWNSDGMKDLLVGRKGTDGVGYVSFYKNIGTDASPLFSGYVDILACSNTCLLNVPGSEG